MFILSTRFIFQQQVVNHSLYPGVTAHYPLVGAFLPQGYSCESVP